MNELIYLDYNATTPLDERVLSEMLPYFTGKFGNASSKTHSFGWRAEQAVEIGREQVAKVINASSSEIIFTSGATEAINLAIKGVYEAYTIKGKRILFSDCEHKAVIDTCHYLATQGAEVIQVPCLTDGIVDVDYLANAITEDTILVSVMLANNETGVIQPVKKIGELCRRNKVLFFCDATQAVGKIEVDVEDLNIDIMCMSAHKFYGPKGVGALYVRRKNPRVTLKPLIHGGGQEMGLRSGTLNVPGIVGMGKAIEISQESLFRDSMTTSRLRTLFEQHMEVSGRVYINGSVKHRLPNTTNLLFEGINNVDLIKRSTNVAVALGSACTSVLQEPSHVLKAMGRTDAECNSSIRFSFGRFTTEEELNKAVQVFKKAISELRN